VFILISIKKCIKYEDNKNKRIQVISIESNETKHHIEDVDLKKKKKIIYNIR
jgi:hypothetical protein